MRHLRRRISSSRTERSKFEERVGLASQAAARFDWHVDLLCLEAAGRVVVEYFDVSMGWVQQQQKQLEQHEQFEQQKQLELQKLVQRQQRNSKCTRTGRNRCGCWRILYEIGRCVVVYVRAGRGVVVCGVDEHTRGGWSR